MELHNVYMIQNSAWSTKLITSDSSERHLYCLSRHVGSNILGLYGENSHDQCALWGLRSVWALLCAQWAAQDPRFLHADSEDSDQTGRMPRLIWEFAGRTGHFFGFVMQRLILQKGIQVWKMDDLHNMEKIHWNTSLCTCISYWTFNFLLWFLQLTRQTLSYQSRSEVMKIIQRFKYTRPASLKQKPRSKASFKLTGLMEGGYILLVSVDLRKWMTCSSCERAMIRSWYNQNPFSNVFEIKWERNRDVKKLHQTQHSMCRDPGVVSWSLRPAT